MSNADNKLLISSSPQFHFPGSTAKVMWAVSLMLLPAGIWGVYAFGPRAAIVLAVSVLAAVVTEGLMNLLMKKNTLSDGSAVLTGLLIGYNMPASVPYFIPVMASVFALVVVKWTFGGLGCNWMNPALAGRVFVFFSWTGAMTKWTVPFSWKVSGSIDGVTGPSPLGALKSGLLDVNGPVDGPVSFLNGLGIQADYSDLFIGRVAGSIGEVSALLLIIGGLILIALRIVKWEIPLAYLLSFVLMIWIFEGFRYGHGFFTGDILFHTLSGGFLLGCLFMATDMVTSPVSSRGMLIYGVGCGLMTFLIRVYGSFPEGVSLAIIIMNIFVPIIDRYTEPSQFGHPSKRSRK